MSTPPAEPRPIPPAKRRAALTTEQAAVALGVTRNRLWSLIVTGELVAFDVATAKETRPLYRITQQALAAYRRKHRVQPREIVRVNGLAQLKKP